MKYLYLFILSFLLISCSATKNPTLVEHQLTFDYRNHDLDNNDNFSPDGNWLVFDTRTGVGGIGGSPSVERVNVKTGKTEVIFKVENNSEFGPGAGAASYHPSEEKVIFIHGLEHCTKENPYQQWRRTGVIVNTNQPGKAVYMDSRDVTWPFTAGALRGGTHRHEWSRDGRWVGYTYNDAFMKKLEDSTGVKWNLRTIAVSTQNHKALVDKDLNGENVQGGWYGAVVVRVVPNPVPGSDEISNAASDSWIGKSGYLRPDGKYQVARAFLGKVMSKKNGAVDELYVVDIPDSINNPGEWGPLEGTETTFPMPPAGTVQRRLTFTADTQFPGCSGVVRSSPDGKSIAFLKKDSLGIQQVFLISPMGGKMTQLTSHSSGVQSGVRWSHDGKSVIYICENSIFKCKVSAIPFGKRITRLTAKSGDELSNIVWSNDDKTIAFNRNIAEKENGQKWKQIFVIFIP